LVQTKKMETVGETSPTQLFPQFVVFVAAAVAADSVGSYREGSNEYWYVGGLPPQQFDAFIKSELKRWPEVVRTAGIQAN